jgi:hypothetical protein
LSLVVVDEEWANRPRENRGSECQSIFVNECYF